jgi:hypothetical protein
MTDCPNQFDGVLGGEWQLLPAADSAILGGIEALKNRLTVTDIEERIVVLWQATHYGEAGMELILPSLDDEVELIRIAAREILNSQPSFSCVRSLLKAEQWQAADEITTALLVNSSNQNATRQIRVQDIVKEPYKNKLRNFLFPPA